MRLPLIAVICLSAGALGLTAFAAGEKFDTLKVGDETYTKVVVTEVTATDLYFNHSRGVANVKLKRLSPELQQQFGFQPEKAAVREQQQRAAAAAYAEKLAKEPPPQRKVEPEPEPEEKPVMRQIPSGPWTNKRAPGFVVEKWLTAEPNRHGKFLLVDFWATWCGPCRKSIPQLNEWHRQYGEQMVIVGLSSETEAEVRRMTQPKMEYAVAIDTRRRMSSTVGVKAIPYILLIDPQGIVRYEGYPWNINGEVLESLFAQFGQ